MRIDPAMEGQVDKCEVRNLTCVNFPTVEQCSGIAMGGCLGKCFAFIIVLLTVISLFNVAARIQIITMIFSPRVVLFLLIGITGLTLATVFFTYYW